jgi:hypothetical protein
MPASTMTTTDDPRPIELRDSSLGRMLAWPYRFNIIVEAAKLPLEDSSADDSTARFFAIVARRASDEAPATAEAYDAGTRIDPTHFAELSKDALDALAGAYLAEEAGSMVSQPPRADGATDPLPGERQSERLLRLVKASIDELNKSALAFEGHLNQLTIPESLKRSFAHTSLLAHNLDDSLAKMRMPALSAGSAERPGLELPPSAMVEINNLLAKLLDISRQQAELSAALTQTSQAALGQAVSSGEHAKRATWLAVVAILVVVMLGGVSTYDNHQLASRTEGHLDTLTETVKPFVDLQRQSITALGALQGTVVSTAKTAEAMSNASDADRASRQDEIQALRDLTRQIENLIQAPTAAKSIPAPKKKR